MAKKITNNMVHTFGKINKYIIFFGMLSAILNIGFTLNSVWFATANLMVEGSPHAADPVVVGLRFFTINTLIVFGVAALLLQLNHMFAKRNLKVIYGVSVVSAGLLIWTIVSNILMFVEI